jgi:hypothetical protein
MAKMVPIKRTAADKKAEREKYDKPASIGGGDDYPYSSRLELDHETLGKLGLHDGELPNTETPIEMTVRGHVSRSENHMVDGESRRRLEIQVTHLPHRLGIAGGDSDGDSKPGAGVRGDLEAAVKASEKKS